MDNQLLGSINDPYSSSKPEEAKVLHMELNLTLDFIQRVLIGLAILTIERTNSLINEIILDTHTLKILSVTIVNGTTLLYDLIENSLHISLPQAVDINVFKIKIKYKTNPNSRALYWLKPKQTADQTYHFLLSNNELIYARSWFPCQDTPSVKFTYSARISVPKNYTVLMSANRQNIYRESPWLDEFEFRQDIHVPSYMVVIAVGSLPMERSYGEYIFMYAERNCPFFDTFPLATIKKMLEIANKLCRSYSWERYDICVLPPSIAHFKIECPCVTFIPPNLLGADKLYISSLMAPKILQNWTGTIVTCVNWDHLWLNKSLSIFISRKIICQISNLNGMEEFLKTEGLRELNKMLGNPKNRRFLRPLVSNLTGTLLHDAIKYVPYEWGCKFLDHLQNMLGGPSVFEKFLQMYFTKFCKKSIHTKRFIKFVETFVNRELFHDMHGIFRGKRQEIFKEWFIKLPTIEVLNISKFKLNTMRLGNKWAIWVLKHNENIKFSNIRIGRDFSDMQKIILIKCLHFSRTRMTIDKLRYLSHILGVNKPRNKRNAEVWYLWLLLCIKVRWDEKVKPALNFAIKNCCPNFACTIFQHLYEWDDTREIAIRTYQKHKDKMILQTKEELNTILHLTP